MRASSLLFLSAALFCLALILGLPAQAPRSAPATAPGSYFGFDRNDYPGDDALPVLRKTFSFTSYWLGPPPGERQSSWLGKRALLHSYGFGFVLLFNGRDSRTLKSSAEARQKGILDAHHAAQLAQQEEFPSGTVIFLDIEEGGRLPAPYHQYIASWHDALSAAHFRAGVYCSAMPVDEGQGVSITTAQDIQAHGGAGNLVYWVYNDACPPSPGCAFPRAAPSPAQSGFPGALVWQYAQSPRRRQFTAQCPGGYASDGNCYAPGDVRRVWFLDLNVAVSRNSSAVQ